MIGMLKGIMGVNGKTLNMIGIRVKQGGSVNAF